MNQCSPWLARGAPRSRPSWWRDRRREWAPRRAGPADTCTPSNHVILSVVCEWWLSSCHFCTTSEAVEDLMCWYGGLTSKEMSACSIKWLNSFLKVGAGLAATYSARLVFTHICKEVQCSVCAWNGRTSQKCCQTGVHNCNTSAWDRESHPASPDTCSLCASRTRTELGRIWSASPHAAQPASHPWAASFLQSMRYAGSELEKSGKEQ